MLISEDENLSYRIPSIKYIFLTLGCNEYNILFFCSLYLPSLIDFDKSDKVFLSIKNKF